MSEALNNYIQWGWQRKTELLDLIYERTNGKVYQGYLAEGFEPLALIQGFSVTTFPYTNETNKAWFEEKSCDFIKK